ncbi:MAG: CDP-glycerol glycerophosphotransferase family protein [Jatrophihabitantaceae bacterium]
MDAGRLALVASGESLPAADGWVVFVGPDGAPSSGDLARIETACRRPVVLVVAGANLGRIREVDVEREPSALTVDDPVFAFRAELLREYGLFLDPDVDHDLAVPLLAAEYLLSVSKAQTIVLAGLRDHRPEPADWRASTRYTIVPDRYAALLARAAAFGPVPRWLQQAAVSRLGAYLHENGQLFTVTASLPVPLVDAFHDGLTAVLRYVDDDTVLARAAAGLTAEMRFALLYGAQHRRGHTLPGRRIDAGRGLVRHSYLFAGDPPGEQLTVDGVAVHAPHRKTRRIETLGRALIGERILWAPAGAGLALGGDEVPVPASAGPGRIARYRRIVRENSGIAGRVAGDLRIRLRARTSAAGERYRDAWLLIDRDTAAGDNAEHLYRYLRAAEPDVNAWFVLARDSADWERLATDGFRLLAFGSDEYFVALLHCAHLVSSQIDDYVVKPFYKHVLGQPRWRFTFLQHGVILHDLSRWLNRKAVDLFVTSTPDEQRSIVGEATPYVFTDLETRMVGLARHDRLLRLAERAERTRLVVMPTWRRELLGAQELGNQRRPLVDFWHSPYAQAWLELLESDRLRVLCEGQGWQLTFVPHPNMSDYLDTSPLPPHIATHRFGRGDVQPLLAGAAALVTDYSSLAMEAAFLGRPVVYHQFDRDAFYDGRLYQRGDWSYERQGFGPIASTADETVDALARIARDGGANAEYTARMQRAFPLRDGRNCERTVAAIRAIAHD